MIVRAWRSRKKAGFLSSGVRSALVLLGGMFLVPLLLGSTGCRTEHVLPTLTEARFSDEGLELFLSQALPQGWLTIQEEDGRVLQRLPVRGADGVPRVLFSWQGAHPYVLVLETPAGEELSRLKVTSPDPRPLHAFLHLPYGQTPLRLEPVTSDSLPTDQAGTPPSSTALLPRGASIQLGLELRSSLGGEVRLSLNAASALTLRPPLPARVQLEPGRPVLLLSTLTLPQEDGRFPVALSLDAHLTPGLQSSRAVHGGGIQAEGASLQLATQTALEVQDEAAVRAGIVLLEHRLPTDPTGRAQLERQADVLVLTPLGWWRLLGILGQGALRQDPYAPVAWQTLRFRNLHDAPVTLLLSSSVLKGEGKGEVEGFVPQAFEVTGGLGRITSLARIPAKGEGEAVLPVYARPSVQVGTYLSRVEVRLLGASPVQEVLRPLRVVRRELGLLGVVLTALVFTLLGGGWLVWRWRSLLETLGPRLLTRISLLAALEVAVGMGVDLTGVWLTVLLGPLSVMVTGLLLEALHYGLVAVLVVQLPLPGGVALLGLTRGLVRGLMTGQLAPTDLLFLGTSLFAQEAFLWTMGVTRGRQAVGLPRLLLACLPASVLAASLSLGLHSVLFRLYYAPWYWWMTCLVALVGPVPGLVYGLKWGKALAQLRD